jgi:hypothetical protein
MGLKYFHHSGRSSETGPEGNPHFALGRISPADLNLRRPQKSEKMLKPKKIRKNSAVRYF